jgi:Membrane bound O-acyl transferase family
MWLLAGLVWLACKLFMWGRTGAPMWSHGGRAALAYFFGWPGMDARPFLHPRNPANFGCDNWAGASLRALVGAGFVWLIARHALRIDPLLGGWVGMIGTALMLHFGVFHLLGLAWRRRGVEVTPLMNQPTRAIALTDFWSRWNHGFRDVAHGMVFGPLRHRLGAAGAMLATFLFSGLVHDLVISVPARGGYGLPTLYFLIQGAGILFEKSRPGRCLPPLARRLLMYFTVIAPMPLLFHPPFVTRVFVPFLAAIGAVEPEGRSIMTLDLTTLIRIGGLLHFGILLAGVLMPQVLNWRSELRKLHPLSRHIIWTHGMFILLTIIAFGLIATIHAPALAAGGPGLGRAFCAFVAIFWSIRVAIQFVLFDPGPLLSTPLLRLGYHGLTIVFIYFACTFGWAAVQPL